VAQRTGALLVVNDRLDVALATGAGGLQLGGGSLRSAALPVEAAALRVGRSVHDEEEARAAGDVAWLLVGTLFPTPSHPNHPGAGTDLLSLIGAHSEAPLIGIGGVTPARIAGLLEAGAHGVAVRGAVWDAPDAVEALQRYLSAVHGPSDPDTSQRP
jgi:thiamine-phosphate diphosphorylase